MTAFNDGDLDRLVETLDPEVEIHSVKGIRRGVEEAREWGTRAPGGVQQQVLIEELHESGDQVVALIRRRWFWEGTDELAGEEEMAHLFTLRDGKIRRWEPFEDRAEALRVAGLPD